MISLSWMIKVSLGDGVKGMTLLAISAKERKGKRRWTEYVRDRQRGTLRQHESVKDLKCSNFIVQI